MDHHIVSKPSFCKKCDSQSRFTLHIEYFGNGSQNFCWRCDTCETRLIQSGSGIWVSKEAVEAKLTQEQIKALPTVMPVFYHRCAVCGDRGTENHHWAPRGIFGQECEKWPQDWLCKRHHDEWHVLVTPSLVLQ